MAIKFPFTQKGVDYFELMVRRNPEVFEEFERLLERERQKRRLQGASPDNDEVETIFIPFENPEDSVDPEIADQSLNRLLQLLKD